MDASEVDTLVVLLCSLRARAIHGDVITAGGGAPRAIQADNTMPPRLVRMECNEWVLDADGNVSQDIVQAEIVKKIDPVAGPIDFSMLGSAAVTAQDMASILKCLGIPIE